MTNSATTGTLTPAKVVLFNADMTEGLPAEVYLNTYDDGHQDLVVPYGSLSGTVTKAQELLAQQGLTISPGKGESWPTGTYFSVTKTEPAAAVDSSRVLLVRTGRTVAFLELHIGEVFYFDGAFWTRTDTYTGTDLRPRGRQMNPPPNGTTWGSCSFGVQEDTMKVEEVQLQFQPN